MAPEQLRHVSDPFFRANPGARPGAPRGTGLGLSIVRGAAFFVTLPRTQPPRPAAGAS
jgi:signal transduction histidine kinase